jgi:hypothetical protein
MWHNGSPIELVFTHESQQNYNYTFRWKDSPDDLTFQSHSNRARLNEFELRPLGTFAPNDHQMRLVPDPKRPDGILLKGRWMMGKVINGRQYSGNFDIPLSRRQ